MPQRKESIIGATLGKLKILESAGRSGYYICLCDCGATVTKYISHLMAGNGLACRKCSLSASRRGKPRSHGATVSGKVTRAYLAWKNMRQRCTNPNKPKYHNHGGRGIKVAPEWEDFATFLADMGEPPPGLSIERRNNELGYSKDNCYWATRKEQCRNTRVNIVFTVRGVTGCLAFLCEHFRVKYRLAYVRIWEGWEPEAALFTPKKQVSLHKKQ